MVRRLPLLLLGCVLALAGCDGVLGIKDHVLAEAGEGGQVGDGGAGLDADADSRASANPGTDGGDAHPD